MLLTKIRAKEFHKRGENFDRHRSPAVTHLFHFISRTELPPLFILEQGVRVPRAGVREASCVHAAHRRRVPRRADPALQHAAGQGPQDEGGAVRPGMVYCIYSA